MTEVKERPIIFSAAMVRAILADTKTQTRRIIKPQPLYDGGRTPFWYENTCEWADSTGIKHKSPYGLPGDRLYVKETWNYANWNDDGEPWIRYRADGAIRLITDVPYEWSERLSDVWAELSNTENYGIDNTAADRKWRPSIFMPAWASRIMLEVTNVRLERLHNITESDAQAEGCDGNCPVGYLPAYQAGPLVYHYQQIFEAIYGTDSWDKNPWVWVIEFRMVDNEDHI